MFMESVLKKLCRQGSDILAIRGRGEIRATKKNGDWMINWCPLTYAISNRKQDTP